jgi:hypothetical protein
MIAVAVAVFAGNVCLAQAEDTQSIGEPGREAGKPNPLKNFYFGEQHMHTPGTPSTPSRPA